MIRIRTFHPKEVMRSKHPETFASGGEMLQYDVMIDLDPDKKTLVLGRDGEWSKALGMRCKVPLIFDGADTVELGGDGWGGDAVSEIFICKRPEGYLYGATVTP